MTQDVEAEQLLHEALKSPVCHWLCPPSSWMYGGTFRTKLNQHNLKFRNGGKNINIVENHIEIDIY